MRVLLFLANVCYCALRVLCLSCVLFAVWLVIVLLLWCVLSCGFLCDLFIVCFVFLLFVFVFSLCVFACVCY